MPPQLACSPSLTAAGDCHPTWLATRAMLDEFYAESNEHLAALVGDDRYLAWHRGAASSGARNRTLY